MKLDPALIDLAAITAVLAAAILLRLWRSSRGLLSPAERLSWLLIVPASAFLALPAFLLRLRAMRLRALVRPERPGLGAGPERAA